MGVSSLISAIRDERALARQIVLCTSIGLLVLARLPIRMGWNSAAAIMVVKSEIANSLPMLDVLWWLENHRPPNAVVAWSAR